MSNPTVKKAAKSAAKPDAAEDLNEQAATATAEADPWAEALAEQAAAPSAEAKPVAVPRNAGADVFQPLSANTDGVNARDLEMIMDIPVKLSVELGRTRLTIKQLLELAQGSVVELDGLPGEPMDILINGYLIAQGEVVVVEDKFGIRITEIITPSERLQRLNR
jgi:flagellar motor switch protein FliN/FliY